MKYQGFRAFATRGRDCPEFPVVVSRISSRVSLVLKKKLGESLDVVLMTVWPIQHGTPVSPIAVNAMAAAVILDHNS